MFIGEMAIEEQRQTVDRTSDMAGVRVRGVPDLRSLSVRLSESAPHG